MRCKNCGGELLLQESKAVCQSCGSVLVIEHVHESIDAYICYKENDTSGRRTKDSIIAQEVYEKLKAAKISAFYERISADGIAGEDLEATKYAAMQKAKTVLVLGTSPENFQAVVEKYGSILEQKTVIPFCVDIKPDAIPKAISKVQAINYSTIGWDQDLVKGLYNLLGREKELDTKKLYGNAKKKKSIIICAAIAISLILLAAVLFFIMSDSDSDADTQLPSQGMTQATEEAAEKEMTTEKILSPNEIYAQATTAMGEGKFVEALNLFAQIPEHKDSSNKIKLIYAKYEGYYKSGDVSLHLDVADNLFANIEVTIASKSNIVRFSVGTTIVEDTIAGDYRDNNEQTGTLELILENSGLRLSYGTDEASKEEVLFVLAEKSDEPFLQVDRQTLLSWLESKLTLTQIRQKGYEIEKADIYDRAGDSLLYKVKDAEIYLSMFTSYSGESALIGVQAPAWILAPDYIGSEVAPFLSENLIYWPYGFMTAFSEDIMSFYTNPQSAEEIISEDTLIGITSKKVLTATAWDYLLTDLITTKVEMDAMKMYDLQLWVDFCKAEILTENDTHLLLTVNTEYLRDAQMRAWYKVSKNNYEVSFIKEGPYTEGQYGIAEDLWFSEYFDFALEFPDAVDIKPGTEAWDEKLEEIMVERAVNEACNRYPQDTNEWISREVTTKNDTHILICIRPQSLSDKQMCAWYKGNKKDVTVTFIREGPFAYDGYQFSKVLWVKEYADLAADFPGLYASFKEAMLPYLNGVPYVISVEEAYYAIQSMPSYESEYIEALAAGTHTIVEEQYDELYNLWGKLESGEGWICLSEIWEDTYWGYN